MEFIWTFLIGFVAFPALVALLEKLNTELFAKVLIGWMEKIFGDEQKANKVSNVLGLRLINLGIQLITGIEDNKKARERLSKLVFDLSELSELINDKEV